MRRPLAVAAAALLALAIWTPAAPAHVGLQAFDVAFEDSGGAVASQSGSHPFAFTTALEANTVELPGGGEAPDEPVKDLLVTQMDGFAGNQGAVPQCSTADFLVPLAGSNASGCPDASAIGLVQVEVGTGGGKSPFEAPLYNLAPPPGKVAKLGFWVSSVPVSILVGLTEQAPYRLVVSSLNTSQTLEFFSARVEVWGTPADPVHDPLRGRCYNTSASCPAGIAEVPFLTAPRACTGPLASEWSVDSWQSPGVFYSGSALTRDDAGNPAGMGGCAQLPFGPEASARPTTGSAASSSGLDFELKVADEGFANPDGLAASDIKRAEVALPEGMTINPSQAEGLGVCSEAQLDAERPDSAPGEGCPQSSKVGTLEVETPQLPGRVLSGAVYVAEPYANRAGGSLVALYFVIRDRELGISVIQPVRVEPDPRSGRLVAITEQMPQVPLSRVRVRLREGGRSPLITPRLCGSYETRATFTPWAGGPPHVSTSSFQIGSGIGGGPCPPPGTPPFEPGFDAGSLNNSAGAHSPFQMQLTRRDGDQDLTRFSAALPPGLAATLAGVGRCSEAAIAQARSRTGIHGGAEELASPSCPASSRIGTVRAGAGVGTDLTYVPGSVYLAGPHSGAPLSVVAIVPAVAGPFDVGTVVSRFALRIDPRSAAVEVDGAASDPIPHILAGIPLSVRDIQASVDRPGFTLNPTSCDPTRIGATLWGGAADLFSPLDDLPLSRSVRYQAAGCASLGFKPRLELRLRGGTRRGQHPALTGTYAPRPGDANLKGLVLRFPRSAFLEQAHIRTICTRVQFAAKACPPGAAYGRARAWTPLLEEPLEGPVYLRASSNPLPDFVADLHGVVDIEAVARIDSKNGGIRATFIDAPDAPLSKVVVQMRGGKKGLIVNSANLCARKQRANATFTAHNGRRIRARPAVRAVGCRGKANGRRGAKR